MPEAQDEDFVLIAIPAPSSDEMVKFLAAQMDQMFQSIAGFVPFTTGDLMSACLCHIVEAGKLGRGDDMDGLRSDIINSVEIAIAHYGKPERKDQH